MADLEKQHVCKNHCCMISTGEKCYTDFQNVASSFWRSNNGKDTSFQVLLQLQKWNKWRNLSLETERSQLLNVITCWQFHLSHFRPFERQFEHASDCCQDGGLFSLTTVCVKTVGNNKMDTILHLPTHQISGVWLLSFPEFKMVIKWRRFNNIIHQS
jgi:hypothetical protein